MDGVWNIVFTGVLGAPASHCASEDGQYPYTTIDTTPQVAEKPYVTIDDAGLFYLNIPAPKVRCTVAPLRRCYQSRCNFHPR